jgi:Ice-binding-like
MALLLAASLAGCGDGSLDPILGSGGIPDASVGSLGILEPFGIASYGGITNDNTGGTTQINGDVVLNPTYTCNGGTVGSTNDLSACLAPNIPLNNAGDRVVTPIFPDTTTAPAVTAALNAKWNSLSPAILPGATVLGCGTIGSAGGAGVLIGCAGNSTLPPGTYISATSSTIGVAGTLTLNGSATDVWVFQAPSALTTAVSSTILLTGGAKASNVWWFVGSSASLGGGTTFNGNVLASASISMGTLATSCGRLLAGAEGSGAFSFLANTVSVPGHANAPVGCE